MPLHVKSFQPTPNPNALKCVLDRAVVDAPLSLRSPPAAGAAGEGASEAERLAAALFAIPGVVGLLFNGDWVTVNKAPEAEWSGVKAAVRRVLAGEGE